MKVRIISLTAICLLIINFTALSQPIPVELMMGYKYGSVNLSFVKNFTQESKFGFFHMNTVQFDYNDGSRNSFILQDQIYVEAFKNFRVTGGVAYSKGGFDPTAGFQYSYNGKKLFFLFAPRVNIESDPTYDIMTIVHFRPQINDKMKLFTRLQMLNLFDSGGNIRSYQWFRIGLDIKSTQFGIALNLDEYSKDPVEFNAGVFIRKEIF